MKVGTDGVLLGAWANVSEAKHLLDIGTGTGLIAIMAAQRKSDLLIDAIEIEQAAYEQAQENVNNCPWKERIKLYQGPVQNFTPDHPYDSIICNPPFFINSTPNPERNKTLARHCETLSHENLLEVAQRLLTREGKLHVILPIVEANHFIQLAQSQKWFINKLTSVCPTPSKAPKRYLIETSRCPKETTSDSLIIEIDRHIYHETYIHLTKDFYLHL